MNQKTTKLLRRAGHEHGTNEREQRRIWTARSPRSRGRWARSRREGANLIRQDAADDGHRFNIARTALARDQGLDSARFDKDTTRRLNAQIEAAA